MAVNSHIRAMVLELIEGTQQLIADKTDLEERLKYCQSALIALEADNREYARRLKVADDTNAAVCSSQSLVAMQKGPSRYVKDTDWISNWLYCSEDASILTPVEQAWKQGNPQRALSLLTPISNGADLTDSQRVDTHLLRSSILRSSGDSQRGLKQAELALAIATNADLHDQIGKTNFHRGLCYANMHEMTNAWWCYTLAMHTDGHEELIQTNRDIAKRMMRSVDGDGIQLRFSIPETDLCHIAMKEV